MSAMPSSPNRKRLEVPTYFHDALKRIADAEERTVSSVLGELLLVGLRDYRPTWIPREHLKAHPRARRVLGQAQEGRPPSTTTTWGRSTSCWP